MPITGAAGSCARAASGQAAAPPSSVMKSRRFIALTPNSKITGSIAGRGSAPQQKQHAQVRYGSWLCQNSSTRRRRRNILKELHIRESKILHTTMFDALMKNCFFYISRMYEFLHRLGHDQTSRHHLGLSALPLKADKRVRSYFVRFVPKADNSHCSRFTRSPHQSAAAAYQGCYGQRLDQVCGRTRTRPNQKYLHTVHPSRVRTAIEFSV